jgi:hypothetical protein
MFENIVWTLSATVRFRIAQIAAGIAEFGCNNPILMDTKAGIIAGHGWLLADWPAELKLFLCSKQKSRRGYAPAAKGNWAGKNQDLIE